jgi:hypothetical protein
VIGNSWPPAHVVYFKQSSLRPPRQLDEENNRMKRLVADLTLDKHMLSEALRKNA